MNNIRDLNAYSYAYLGPFEEIQVQFRRKKVLEILAKYKHENILEVSCGKDSIVNYIPEKDYKNFYIVEPIKEFLNLALIKKSPEIFCFNDCIENLPELSLYHFDFIIVSSLLHEVIDPQNIMNTIHGISQKDTLIHVNVPNANSFHRLLALEMGLITSVYEKSENQQKLQQNHTFDFNSLTKLCESSGFSVLEKGAYLIKPFTHLQMQQLIDKEIIDTRILEGLYNMVKYMPEWGSEIYLNLVRK